MISKRFEIIPAIDLIGGEAVRLSQGDYTKKTVYGKDPLEIAKKFEAAGIRRLHLVDLDGAKAGRLHNLHVLETVAANTGLTIDFGGGISVSADMQSVFSAGAAMAAVGSIAVKQPERFADWVEEFGADRIFLGADVRQGYLAVKGWTEDTSLHLNDFLESQLKLGIQHVFCTDISRDGMLQGPSTELYRQLLIRFPKLNLVASGGVSSADDLPALKEAGCSGVIIGKALYENRISLDELNMYL
jgi:phosphoribosylformimino-5-aminoimidazole carboxamide ribotide isomerase